MASPALAPIHDKIKDIESKLRDIRSKKKEMELESDKSRVRSPPRDYSKPLKAYFHHPHLDYVFGEIVHSPYMTKPLDPYSTATLTMTNKLIDMKSRGIKFEDLPPEQRPYNVKKVRNQFIHDVINYRVVHDYKKLKESSESKSQSRTGSPANINASINSSSSMKLSPVVPVNGLEERSQSAPEKEKDTTRVEGSKQVRLAPIERDPNNSVSRSQPELRPKQLVDGGDECSIGSTESKRTKKAAAIAAGAGIKKHVAVSKSLPSLPPRTEPTSNKNAKPAPATATATHGHAAEKKIAVAPKAVAATNKSASQSKPASKPTTKTVGSSSNAGQKKEQAPTYITSTEPELNKDAVAAFQDVGALAGADKTVANIETTMSTTAASDYDYGDDDFESSSAPTVVAESVQAAAGQSVDTANASPETRLMVNETSEDSRYDDDFQEPSPHKAQPQSHARPSEDVAAPPAAESKPTGAGYEDDDYDNDFDSTSPTKPAPTDHGATATFDSTESATAAPAPVPAPAALPSATVDGGESYADDFAAEEGGGYGDDFD